MDPYIDVNRGVSTFELLTVDNITEQDTLSEEDADDVVEVVTHQGSTLSIENSKIYLSQIEGINDPILKGLCSIEALVHNHRETVKVQRTINDFL